MRDTVGGRPYEVSKEGDKFVFKFYPMVKDAKHPDTAQFSFKGTRDEIKKMIKSLG